ncbi:MAG: hypothetical protein FWF36_00035 [Propionibacteriaceae bacterium]|nr:hypothetical protein [Propionibacteriaceae bacterium]
MKSIDPSSVVSGYGSDDTLERYLGTFVQALGLGRNDYADLAITFDMNGQTWLFVPNAGRYNGRWYLLSQTGFLADLLGMNGSTFLVPMP